MRAEKALHCVHSSPPPPALWQDVPFIRSQRKKRPWDTGWGSPSKTQSLAETAFKWRRIGPHVSLYARKIVFRWCRRAALAPPPTICFNIAIPLKQVSSSAGSSLFCSPASDLRFTQRRLWSLFICPPAIKRLCLREDSVRGEFAQIPVKMDCNHFARGAQLT